MKLIAFSIIFAAFATHLMAKSTIDPCCIDPPPVACLVKCNFTAETSPRPDEKSSDTEEPAFDPEEQPFYLEEPPSNPENTSDQEDFSDFEEQHFILDESPSDPDELSSYPEKSRDPKESSFDEEE